MTWENHTCRDNIKDIDDFCNKIAYNTLFTRVRLQFYARCHYFIDKLFMYQHLFGSPMIHSRSDFMPVVMCPRYALLMPQGLLLEQIQYCKNTSSSRTRWSLNRVLLHIVKYTKGSQKQASKTRNWTQRVSKIVFTVQQWHLDMSSKNCSGYVSLSYC